MSFLKKVPRGGCPVDGLGGTWSVPAVDSANLPALSEFLSAGEWPDGTPRQPGSMLLFFEAGRWKVCLTDRAQQLMAFTTVPTLLEALLHLEESYKAGTLEWRSRPQDGARRQGK